MGRRRAAALLDRQPRRQGSFLRRRRRLAAHWTVPEQIGSLALRKSGGAVVSLRDGFYALDFETGDCRKLVDPDPDKPRIRMNDGKVDRQGRFVAG